MNNPQAIVVDADDMIIHTKEYYSTIFARENNLDEEQLAEFFDFEFQQCIIGEADLKEELKPYLKKWGVSASVDEFIKQWFKTESKLNKELIQYIKAHKKEVPYYLMSNQEKYRAHYMIETLGLSQLFEHCFFSYEMYSRKPEEKAYRYVIDSLGYLEAIDDPANIMFWDSKEENVAQASQIGLNAHLYSSYHNFSDVVSQQENLD